MDAQLELKACQQRIEEILSQLNNPSAPKITDRAAAWLDGAGDPGARPISLLWEELSKRYGARQVLTEAVRLQRQRIAHLGAELSKDICLSQLPEYHAILLRMKAALETLARVHGEAEAFRNELRMGGISFVAWIRPIFVPHMGTLEDPQSGANVVLREIDEYLTASSNTPEPPKPPEKKPLLRRMKGAVAPSDDDWTTTA